MISRRGLLSAFAALGLILAPVAAPAEEGRWVGAWASSQMTAENEHVLPNGALDDVTLRQVVRLTASGDQIRVRVSNASGDAPLRIASATVIRPATRDGATVDPATVTPLTFAGRPDVMVPAGAEFVSDPVDFAAEALSHLAVTFHVADAPAPCGWWPGRPDGLRDTDRRDDLHPLVSAVRRGRAGAGGRRGDRGAGGLHH